MSPFMLPLFQNDRGRYGNDYPTQMPIDWNMSKPSIFNTP